MRRLEKLSKFVGILEGIEQCLSSFGLPVYYGKSFAKENDKWNYFVFNRQSISKRGTSGIDLNYQYQIHIIMEDYIEEDFEIQVIKKLKEELRLKMTETAQFSYVTKGSTDTVVEMLTLTFTKTHKGIDL